MDNNVLCNCRYRVLYSYNDAEIGRRISSMDDVIASSAQAAVDQVCQSFYADAELEITCVYKESHTIPWDVCTAWK